MTDFLLKFELSFDFFHTFFKIFIYLFIIIFLHLNRYNLVATVESRKETVAKQGRLLHRKLGDRIYDDTQSVLLFSQEVGRAAPSFGAGKKQLKESGFFFLLFFFLLLCCCYQWSQGVGRRVEEEKGGRKEQKYLGQAGRFWIDTGCRGSDPGRKGFISAEGKQMGAGTGKGWASYLDRVLSAKCFCWLSACLGRRKQKSKIFSKMYFPVFVVVEKH